MSNDDKGHEETIDLREKLLGIMVDIDCMDQAYNTLASSGSSDAERTQAMHHLLVAIQESQEESYVVQAHLAKRGIISGEISREEVEHYFDEFEAEDEARAKAKATVGAAPLHTDGEGTASPETEPAVPPATRPLASSAVGDVVIDDRTRAALTDALWWAMRTVWALWDGAVERAIPTDPDAIEGWQADLFERLRFIRRRLEEIEVSAAPILLSSWSQDDLDAALLADAYELDDPDMAATIQARRAGWGYPPADAAWIDTTEWAARSLGN